ncbi:UDP-N-acetylmuramoyl-tripeptide--D-alanyl-D-alanine ligase [Methylosarcina fibrata]|uniref:UDP-N-acetylmuramoyl-tripeptide--D-alanyl-D- alanine ligase n=1 Tax=Methylosarcina fibrata TaxID=105972 RepID=UPI0003634833|nr:UDP-N-acetylmuramoyl-tripeptide--D-alanyl-D-alanine ligase [Methylosarcina fibrata]
MQLLLSEISRWVGGDLIGNDVTVSSVGIDTRTIQPGALYIAIKGKTFDGNDFIEQAEQGGAVAAIVRKGVTAGIPHVTVADTRFALAELAGAWRRTLPASIVGVTGSNGKTTVKEMVAAILSVNGQVLYTPGNLNNDIGVPLTLLRLNEQHRYGVIEMGANHHGEIEYTSRYARSDVVILTNAGPAHIEGFGSVEGVARAKGEIIRTLGRDGVAVINRDDRYYDYWKSLAGDRKTLSFGLHDRADLTAKAIRTGIVDNRFATAFQLVSAGGSAECVLQLAGRHNVVNALAAAAAARALGIGLDQIVSGLKTLQPVTGRLQPLIGRKGNVVIDDTYNANSASLKAAVDVLIGLDGEPWLVLGAFGELGSDSLKIHKEMGEMIKAGGVTRLFAVGEDARATVDSFGRGAAFFETQEQLIASLVQELTGEETILVKGSRSQRMENVVAALVDNFRV